MRTTPLSCKAIVVIATDKFERMSRTGRNAEAALLISLALTYLRADDAAPQPTPPVAESNESQSKGEVLPPRLIRTAPPIWPSKDPEKMFEADLAFDVIVSVSGVLGDARLVSCDVNRIGEKPRKELSTRYCPAFETAARNSLKEWKYEPATQDGKPLEIVHRIRFGFHR